MQTRSNQVEIWFRSESCELKLVLSVEMMNTWRNEDSLVKIQRLDLKRSAKCIEEGIILKCDFDYQDELGFWY